MTYSDATLTEAADLLGESLRQHGLMIATAESCTGGWVAKCLTDTAGSSDYFYTGLVPYCNEAKQNLLGVTERSLAEHGAVSEPVVREMVAGTLSTTGAQVAVAVSGVAGPGGGSDEKPVGTVWFAWGRTPTDIECVVEHFSGDRDHIRRQAVLFALQGVRSFLNV